MEETTEFETITPAIAEHLLENNTLNRPLNQRNLYRLVLEMERKNFHITGESIKLSKGGALLDGQHRLWAIIKTGTTLRMPVVRGLEEESFKYMDTGRTRKAADVLSIQGVVHPAQLATMSRFIINFRRGIYYAVAHKENRNKETMITNFDISEFVAKNNAALQESYHYGFNKYNRFITKATLASFHFIFNKISESHADEFCHSLAEGENLNKTSPILLLRNRLIADIRATNKMREIEKLAIVCKAWNAYREKKTLTALKWDSIKEPFPKPI